MEELPRIRIDPDAPDAEAVGAAVEVLRRGGLVVFPTETFYGLGADAGSTSACRRAFRAKGRPAEKAMPCVASDLAQVERFTRELPPAARLLATRFWPGPLSLVLDARPGLAAAAADGTVAVRVSGLAIARSLPAALGSFVVATSANRAGAPPATTAGEATDSLVEAADLVLDGGECPGGAPSTLVDVRSGACRVLREGKIPGSRVLETLSP